MMTDWYEKSMRALQLSGKGERTQEAYTRSVRKLVEFFDKTPDQISETELQDYFLHRRNVDQHCAIMDCSSPSFRLGLKEVCARIELAFGFTVATVHVESVPMPKMTCRRCGHALTYLYSLLPHRSMAMEGGPPG